METPEVFLQHADPTYQLSRHINMLTPLWGMLLSSSMCTLWIWPKNIMFSVNIIWQPECQLGRLLISWVNTFRRTNTVVPWPVLFLLKLWWPVLWMDWWSAGGIIASVDHQLLSGGFQGEDTGSNSPQGRLWVSLYGWHLCDLSLWIREAGMVLGWCPPEHYIHHGNGERDGRLPYLDIRHLE